MYENQDRPSTRRIIITITSAIAAIAAVICLVAVVFGVMSANAARDQQQRAALAKPLATQAPAVVKSPIQQSEPAPSKPESVTYSAPPTPTVAPAPAPAPAAPAKTATVASAVGIVEIDAGHQGQQDTKLEPVGPGSSTMKHRVESGTSGVATRNEESKINLEVALKLQKVLEARGVTVKMVRTSQNVDIPNSQRAKKAYADHADLFIRLHCDSAGSSVTGILTEVPAKNWYPAHPIVSPSAVAGRDVQNAVLSATGAKDRGIRSVGDLSGFNWSQVPSVLVEMGLMSNSAEDRKLATASYQEELANGMANGIVKYLKSK